MAKPQPFRKDSWGSLSKRYAPAWHASGRAASLPATGLDTGSPQDSADRLARPSRPNLNFSERQTFVVQCDQLRLAFRAMQAIGSSHRPAIVAAHEHVVWQTAEPELHQVARVILVLFQNGRPMSSWWPRSRWAT